MRANRLMPWLLLIAAGVYVLRAYAALAAGQDPTGDLTAMFVALALAMLYEMRGDGHDGSRCVRETNGTCPNANGTCPNNVPLCPKNGEPCLFGAGKVMGDE